MAQYIYLDANGDGVNTGADHASVTGQTSVEVWLCTNVNRDSTVAICASGDGELTINSYSIILHAGGGTVDWGPYSNHATQFDLPVGEDSNEADFYVAMVASTVLPPGTYDLGSIAFSVTSGNPSIEFQTGSVLSGVYLTQFGSQCSGSDFDNTLKLGSDWHDASGIGPDPDGPTSPPSQNSAPVVSSPSVVTVVVGSQVSFEVSATDADDDPISSLVADLSALPASHMATFTVMGDGWHGQFTWTPGYADAGTYGIAFEARANGSAGLGVTQIHVLGMTTELSLGFEPVVPLTQSPIPMSLRPGYTSGDVRTLSGSLSPSANNEVKWLLYPGACLARAGGTWTARTSAVADSLNAYPSGSDGGYQVEDRTGVASMWHIVDTSVPSSQRPPILDGSASIWCGTYDAAGRVGYPNRAYSILYIYTGPHSAAYTFSLQMNLSVELEYDYVYLLGGAASAPSAPDPLGAAKNEYDAVIYAAETSKAQLLVSWTGSITSTTPGGGVIDARQGAPIQIFGSQTEPSDRLVSITIPAQFTSLYLVLVSDLEYSNEDGLWFYGHGMVIDDLRTSDNGTLYSEGNAPQDEVDQYGGTVLVGTGAAPLISARHLIGNGPYWFVAPGDFCATSDFCSVQKTAAADKMFMGADPSTKKTMDGQAGGVGTCTLPLPAGTGRVRATWTAYLDLPVGSGFVQWAEYRAFVSGAWSAWKNTRASNAVLYGTVKKWIADGDDLPLAANADSVQLRFNLQCVRNLTESGYCGIVDYGVLYDDFALVAYGGPALPMFGIFPGSLAQSTFVDGTMESRFICAKGLPCTETCLSPPCWPGIRGSDLSIGGIHDNVNSPIGDSIVVSMVSGLRSNGMGINWHWGWFKPANEPFEHLILNVGFQAGVGSPMMLYRLFDPMTKTWSPFDSTEMDATLLSFTGGDTLVVDGKYRVDWPPRDKEGQNLPAGFTVNGIAAYSQLSFLPRGTRLQYYFKAVDIAGGVAYQFQGDQAAHEVDDLPALPGSGIEASDIIEFDVLPGAYPPGHAGTLLASATDTPVLYLDGSYSSWEHGTDQVLEALRGLGVRADRYRRLQGIGFGNGIGGHEPGYQVPRHALNYLPNDWDYAISDSLAKWYRIIIESSNTDNPIPIDESDGELLRAWWLTETGTNAGDRCILLAGNDVLNRLVSPNEAAPERTQLATEVFGIVGAADAWVGTGSILYPTVEDRFANQESGPGLVPGYSYQIDGGCPSPDRFDALTPQVGVEQSSVAFFPNVLSEVNTAAVARVLENDVVTDFDRAKALGYGFSIGSVRLAGIPTSSPSYPHTGVTERMRILYKFLTSCRGPRVANGSDSLRCWPCPSDPEMATNWATSGAFQTALYGSLYPLQDNLAATGVLTNKSAPTAARNRLEGNYPNPFNPVTTIRFSSASAGRATIRIFNVAGRLLRTLDTRSVAGANEVKWDGRDMGGVPLASGIYFYRLRFGDGSESSSRMTILK